MVSCLGSFVQSCCGEGGALQTGITVCGEHSQCSSHTGFAPAHGYVVSPYTLLRLPDALYVAGPVWHEVPVFRCSTKAWTLLGLCFVPSPSQEAQAARSLMDALSLGAVCLLPSMVPSNAALSSLFCPHLLVADEGVWGTFLLGVAFRCVICGFYLFFLPVMLPSEIQKLPPDPLVRGFPGVWKLPLL